MASTASLLFNIVANSDEAESSIASFRALMSKDLSGMADEFGEWAHDVFGNLTTVNGAMLAIAASAAAALNAAVGLVSEASGKYNEFVGEISHSMRLTGQSAETMSALHFAANETRTSFDGLTAGLVRFEGNVVKGAEGSDQLLGSFKKLGVTQADLKAGQQDLMPLLGKVMDGFQNMASGVNRAALAKELFSRSGPELLGFLTKGAEGLAELAKKASDAGLVIKQVAVEDFVALKKAEEALKAQHEALDVVVGKSTIGWERFWETVKAASISALSAGNNASAIHYLENIALAYAKIDAEIQKTATVAEKGVPPPLTKPETLPTLEKVKESYFGISSILDSLRGKVASFGTANEQLAAEMAKYHDQVTKASDELTKLEKAGNITAESAKAQTQALAQIPALLGKLWQEFYDKQAAESKAAAEKQAADQLEAAEGLQAKLAALQESTQGFAGQRAALERENAALAESYSKKGQLTEQMEDLLYQIYTTGMAKIDAAELADHQKSDAMAAQDASRKEQQFQEAMSRLVQHQTQILALHTTGAERLRLDYEKDLQQYSAVEERKVVATATGEAEIYAVHQKFANLRSAITTKYQQDLQTLRNSQGWQGVFGSQFAQMVKGDEELLRQWAQSTNQSLMLVKMALSDLKEMGHQAFQQMAQGMAQGIVQAIQYKTSIGDAMEAALAATVASIAGQALVQAIYSAAWGFLDIAEGNIPGATAAFEASGMFALVGGGAALGARALTPSSASSAASASAAAASGGVAASGADTTAAGAGGGGSTVSVTVNGHIIGVNGAQQLVDIINQAVYENDATLYATHTKAGVPLVG